MASIDNLVKLYEELENSLIKEMTRNLALKIKSFTPEQVNEWKEYQNKRRLIFRRNANNLINRYKRTIRKETDKTFREVYNNAQEKELKRVVRNYGKKEKFKNALSNIDLDGLHSLDERRLASILSAADKDLENATQAVLRVCDDQYRKTIIDASLEYNAGSKTLNKAIDEAQRSFLSKGITSITYSNGAMVNIRSYSEMALRTAGQRAKIEAEASIRDYLGINTVKVSYHGITCEKCGPWQGKILIDDVYQSGDDSGKYPRLSAAIESGFMHPNCRHSLNSIDPEIDTGTASYTYTKTDEEKYKTQQQQRKLERDIRKYKRLEEGTLDPTDKKKFKEKRVAKVKELNTLIDDSGYLTRQRDREKI